MNPRFALSLAAAGMALSLTAAAQRAGAFSESRDHPAIAYSSGEVRNTVAALAEKVEQGSVRLAFDPVSGYLRSLLEALALPLESQVLVYSETSFQARKINRQNPRAVYFNDRVAVGWVRGGDILEIAAHDVRQGMVFYQLQQSKDAAPRIDRNDKCLACHLSWDTLGVPGALVLSVQPRRSDDEYANGGPIDHSSPIGERWGGWFVSGALVPPRQLGNLELVQPNLPATGPQPTPAPRSLEGVFDLRGYPTPYSDVVALMVLEHQAHALNLITRLGWEYRIAAPAGSEAGTPMNSASKPETATLPSRVTEAVEALVDYLLFVDEVRLTTPVRGTSGFAEKFIASGPRDAKGRSLRDLQLQSRLFRYPCSYMIYSPAFEALPTAARDAVFAKISAVLSGRDARAKFAHLSAPDRAAIAEILRATSPSSVRHFL